jgi:hypothetical protein
MSAALLLAVALGVGKVPVASSIEQFPNASAYPASGQRQFGHLLTDIEYNAAPTFRTSGPGPAQLLARWRSRRLSPDERMVALLAGATYHDPVLLPIYLDAFDSPLLRERQAAVVGLAWLLGEPSPDPTHLSLDMPVWRSARAFTSDLIRATAERSLVRVWIDSYLGAMGLPVMSGHGGIGRSPAECLGAIAAIAQPEDLGDLFALWPLLDASGQAAMVHILEVVSVQRFRDVPRGPRAPTGPWIEAAAAERVDGWVRNACHSVNGLGVAMHNIARLADAMDAPPGVVGTALAALSNDDPAAWPVAAELLVPFGGPAVSFDRGASQDATNVAARREILAAFPVTTREIALRAQPSRPRRNRSNQNRRR